MLKNILETLIFKPDITIHSTPSLYNLPYEDIFLSNINSNNSNTYNKYHGWLIENKNNDINFNKELSKYIILYFHGNAGNISTRLNYINKLYSLGFSIMIFDYPGFGLSEGFCFEESCLEVSYIFYKYLHEDKKYSKNNIIFYGESIGGSIATSLALKTKIKYLILHSTFTDISIIIKNHIYIPSLILNQIGFNTLYKLKKRYQLNYLSNKKYENEKEKINRFKTLIIHSKEDELIPYSHALELSKYSTDFYECEGKHTSSKINKEFLNKIIEFIL